MAACSTADREPEIAGTVAFEAAHVLFATCGHRSGIGGQQDQPARSRSLFFLAMGRVFLCAEDCHNRMVFGGGHSPVQNRGDSHPSRSRNNQSNSTFEKIS